MRFFHIAVILLLIQVSIPLVNEMGLFDNPMAYSSEWVSTVNSSKNDAYSQNPTANFQEFLSQKEDDVKGLFYFLRVVVSSIVWIPFTLSIFGMSSPATYYLSIPFYFIYVCAIAEFITKNTNLEDR